MGVLRQKCTLTYEAFVNNSNYSFDIGLNTSYKSYLKAVDNESTLKTVFFSEEKTLSIRIIVRS